MVAEREPGSAGFDPGTDFGLRADLAMPSQYTGSVIPVNEDVEVEAQLVASPGLYWSWRCDDYIAQFF